MLAMPSSLDQRSRSTAVTTSLMAALLLSIFAGCASKSNKWKFANWNVKQAVGLEPKEPEPQQPERMVATWTDTTLSTVGQTPKRGFGGKLMFFKKGSEDPVRVEGNLVVYAFDETDRPDHETHPNRKYIFPMDEFVRHESESSLGPAYSFWLPWDEIGGQQRNISLIAKFEPKEGPVVIGEQTRHLLPGLTIDPNANKPLLTKTVLTDNGEQVRLASYSGQNAAPPATASQESSIVVPAQQRQMSTATIPLPKRLGEGASEPAQQTTAFSAPGPARPLSQLSTQRSGPPQSATANSQVVQASAQLPVDSTPVTTATQRRELNEAAKAAKRPQAGSVRDSLLETLPVRARPSGQ